MHYSLMEKFCLYQTTTTTTTSATVTATTERTKCTTTTTSTTTTTTIAWLIHNAHGAIIDVDSLVMLGWMPMLAASASAATAAATVMQHLSRAKHTRTQKDTDTHTHRYGDGANMGEAKALAHLYWKFMSQLRASKEAHAIAPAPDRKARVHPKTV